MKESDARVEYDSHQLLLYVEKNDGEYGPLQTGSFLTKNYVDDFWQKQKNFEDKTLKQLCDGQISPIGYYMLMTNISAADLAARLGISTRRVRKHMHVSHFTKLQISLIMKYAAVFGVPLANMFQVLLPSSNKKLSFTQRKTSNCVVTTTEIVEEKK